MANEHRPSALVVDDDDDIRELLRVVLTKAGYRVVAVEGGCAALSAAEADPPSVYVLDVRMPDLSGHEVCRLVKADDRKSAPVLILSAESAADDVTAAFSAGCDEFVAKPFAPRDLVSRLDALRTESAA